MVAKDVFFVLFFLLRKKDSQLHNFLSILKSSINLNDPLPPFDGFSSDDLKNHVDRIRNKKLGLWAKWILFQRYVREKTASSEFVRSLGAEIERGAEEYPFYSDFLFMLANYFLFSLSDFERTEKMYRHIMGKFPHYRFSGVIESRLSLFSRAIPNPGILKDFFMAEKKYEDGETDQAIAILNRINQLSPDSPLSSEIHYFLGDIYIFKKRDALKAVAEYRMILEKNPDSELASWALYRIGESYRNSGEFKGAVQVYEQLLKEYPRIDFQDTVHFFLAESFLGIKNRQKAKYHCEVILANFPSSMWKEVARTKIAELLREGN